MSTRRARAQLVPNANDPTVLIRLIGLIAAGLRRREALAEVLDVELLAPSVTQPSPEVAPAPALPANGISFKEAISGYERQLIIRALQASGGVQKRAAERLGISRRKLNYMIRRMGITHASWRRNRDEDEPGDCRVVPLDSAADAG